MESVANEDVEYQLPDENSLNECVGVVGGLSLSERELPCSVILEAESKRIKIVSERKKELLMLFVDC